MKLKIALILYLILALGYLVISQIKQSNRLTSIENTLQEWGIE